MDNISASALAELFLKETPLIDVRAPVEFNLGSLPNSVNLPIMNNEERAFVGTTYKTSGREEALKLGNQLVSGEVRESRLGQWARQIQLRPDAVIYCFRGGLRSQITQRWLAERGIERPLIEGGYKVARTFLREQIDKFSDSSSMLILSGPTGSAKTHILKQSRSFYPSIDLEALACHRGSAFGGLGIIQPSQIDFENSLAVKVLKLASQELPKVLIEDESRLIGRCAIPEIFFGSMREAELLYVEESFEQRVENIFQDYIVQTAIGTGDLEKASVQFAEFEKAVNQISRKLGGARAQEIQQDIVNSKNIFLKDSKKLESNKLWISKLLTYYYDPLYANSLAKRSPKIVIRGNSKVILDYLKSQSS